MYPRREVYLSGPRSHRNWRRRGRRAQVAAVATLLGLLLVVTFIANYLSTQLPDQMQANDLNHEIQVENQVGQYAALLQAVSAAHANGAQITQPISLGSAGVPPFAAPDPAYLSAPANGTWAYINYTLTGTGGTTAITTPIVTGAGLVTHLVNAYTPSSEVALNLGGVVYADLGGIPIFSNPPAISALVNTTSQEVTALSIWMPEFKGTIPGTSGALTATLVSRLISTNEVLASSATHLSVAPGTSVTLTLVSQYAAAWYNYFLAQHWPGVTPTCVAAPPTTSTTLACSSPYFATNNIGKVVVAIPGANLARLDVTVALFSIGVQ